MFPAVEVLELPQVVLAPSVPQLMSESLAHLRSEDMLGDVIGISGNALRDLPTRKCPGVRAETPSNGAESRGVSGRLFNTASTSSRTVVISSQVRR